VDFTNVPATPPLNAMPTSEPTHPAFYRDPVFRRLLRKVLAHRFVLLVAIVAMAISAATEYLIARLTGQFVDRGIIERQATAGIWLPLAFVGVFLVRGLAGFASTFLLNRISQAVLVDLRTAMFDKLITWPQKAFEDTPSGIVISKFINEASNALNLAAEVMTTAVRDSLTVVVLLGVLVYYNWQLTLVTLVVAPLIALALRAFSKGAG
jgi:subfamily B ATP-binding cassette protein MsbA